MNTDSFVSFFSTPLSYFSFLIALADTLNTIFNKSSDVIYPFLDSKENVSKFLLLRKMFVDFVDSFISVYISINPSSCIH